MKRILNNVLALSFGVLTALNLGAQCTTGGSFGSTTIPGGCPGVFATASTCNFAGEYATFNGIQAGQTYQFQSSIATDFLTIVDGGTLVVLAFGTTPVTAVAATNNPLRMYIHTNSSCGTQSACRTSQAACLTCIPAGGPANASCASAIPVGVAIANTGGTDVASGTTVGSCPATLPICVTTLNTAPGVWYTFTPGCTGNVEVNTCAAVGFDTKLGVFTGPCNNLVCVAGNDDAIPPCTFSGLRSKVTFPAVTGTTYYIYVTGFGSNQGQFQLNLIFDLDPCCAADPLTASFEPDFFEICPFEEAQGSLVITGGIPGPPNGQIIGNVSSAGFPGSTAGSISIFNGVDGSLSNSLGVFPTTPFRGGGAVVRNTPASAAPNIGQGFYYVSTPNFYRFFNGVESLISSNLPQNAAANVWDQSTNTMYLATAGFPGTLYTIDINTGALTTIGQFNGGGVQGFCIWLVIDETTGVMYMFDIANDNVYTVNKTNAACTLVGPAGFNGNFGQDAFYWNGAIYSHAFNAGAFALEYRRFNLTGGSALIQGYGFAQIGAEGWLGQTFPGGYAIQWNTTVGLNFTNEEQTEFTILHSNPGTYIYIVTVTDSCGNTTTASMTVVVRDIPRAMACNDNLNISVDFNCDIQIRADMFLEGPYDGCYDQMEVRIWPNGQQGASTPDVNNQTLNFKGLIGTHIFEITNPFTGVKCWGNFTVEDKYPPQVLCEDITVSCLEEARLYLPINNPGFIGRPELVDNCGGAVMSYQDVDFGGLCDRVILRQWSAHDPYWNYSEICIQNITIAPLSFNEVFIPSPLVELNCNDDTSPEGIIATTGNVFDGGPFAIINDDLIPVGSDGICNIYCVYSDQVINNVCGPHCHGNKKIIRTWTCLDWCTGEVSVSFTQLIKAHDTEGPTFILKPDTIVSTSPWYCKADFFLPNPWELHDNCDINPTWTVAGPILTGPNSFSIQPVNHPVYKYRAVGVPKGDHLFVYTASDCCGNKTIQTMIIKVVDKTPPVATAKQNLVISLVPGGPDVDGNAKLFADQVDNGSYDMCGPVRLEIRRAAGSPACENIGNNNYNNNVTFNNNVPRLHPEDNVNDTDNGEFVKFCCEDINTTTGNNSPGIGYHEVILRVWDDGDMNGVFGTLGDNYNETWAWVKVEDKLPPTVVCPPDATIHCDWPIDRSTEFGSGFQNVNQARFDKTGLPTVYATCTTDVLVEFQDQFTAIPAGNNCGLGRITRTFRVTKDGKSVLCTQLITVDPSLSQQQWVITPPPATPVKGMPCTGPTPQQIKANGPSWVAGPCDVIGENVQIDTFLFEDGVCKKWRVYYTYMNWCTGEQRGPFFRDFVYEDLVKPEFDTCRDTMYGVDVNCELVGLRLHKTAKDAGGCTDQGWLKWQVFVDLWADGTIDYEFTSFAPVGTNTTVIVDGVPRRRIYVAPTKNGDPIRGQGNQLGLLIPEPIVGKMSNHKVTWKVSDGCHNEQVCFEQFMVADKKPPTPYCVHLSTALMENGMVELWAKDFDLGATDNCTPQEDLLFTFYNWAPQVADKQVPNGIINIDVPHYFNATGGVMKYPTTNQSILQQYAEGKLQLWLPAFKSSAKVFTCEDRAQLGNGVEVWVTVWDKKFNYDWCVVILTLADNQGACDDGSGPRVNIAGKIARETGETVSDVQVSIDTDSPEYPRHRTTLSDGAFSFRVDANRDYELTASRDGDFANGVTTLDLVMIQRHILQIAQLDSPYKVIAADATNDGKVNVQDLVELRKVILQAAPRFTNSSWRFVNADASFSNPQNPFPFEEVVGVNNVAADMMNNDFVAVKIGDVNNTAVVNATSNDTEARTASALVFVAEAAEVNAGEVIEINITSDNFSEVYGYQFTAELNGLKLAGVRSGALKVDASNVATLENGVMTMSWNAEKATSVEAGEVLFTLVMTTSRSGNTANMMSVGSSVTKAEAYVGEAMSINGVALNFRTNVVEVEGFELGQNEPNPFRDFTTVSYVMPEAAEVTFTVFDMTGKVLVVRKAEAAKGVNTINFNRDELGASGVLIYQIESGDYTASKKMIIIE